MNVEETVRYEMRPKVTIGLMVFNEASSIRSALDSILDQSYKDCEIVVGDNKSTDGSTEIIAEYARNEPRIRHIVRDRNIGALQNWNEIVHKARGQYFALAGGHDLWSPDYLERLVAELDENGDAVLAFAKTQWINEEGAYLDIPTSLIDTSGMSHVKRFIAVMIANQHYLYGLIRVSALRRTRLQKEIIGSGEILLQELAALGSFSFVEGPRWFRRQNRDEGAGLDRLNRYSRALFSSRGKRLRFRLFPHMQMLLTYLALPFVVAEASARERLFILTLYPYICTRFAPAFWQDAKWLGDGFCRFMVSRQ